MNLLTIHKSKATIVVGLDFGTTFSGFAFARTSEPDQVHKFYEWPDLRSAGGGNYCKTQTSLFYETGEIPGSYILRDWGYSAHVKHVRGIKSQQSTLQQIGLGDPTNETARRIETQFLTLFKLHLAGSEAGRISASELPAGLTARRVVSDYLRKFSELIMEVIRGRIGNYVTMEDVQWCLTVPAIWDERGKQEMKTCAAIAGMVQGPECPRDLQEFASPHQMIVVIEPEAASLYCQRKIQLPLTSGDKFLVVDVGGGTVDLVLHEKVGTASSLKVREVSPSSGGLCGGSYVDHAFFDFLARKVGCFHAFAQKHPDSILKLKGWWETIKYGFDGEKQFAYDLELPARLARAWEDYDCSNSQIPNLGFSYDAIELSLQDLLGIFDPIVDQILDLIEFQMIGDLKIMMIVGGFSGSPYLVKRIRQKYSGRVGNIVVPEEPGSAICCGAVLYGIYGADLIMSRKSRKTYGTEIVDHSVQLSNPTHFSSEEDADERCCGQLFSVFITKGDEVPLDHCVSHTYYPCRKSQTEMLVGLYSTTNSNPTCVCNPGVTKEGSFIVKHPSQNELGKCPEVLVSMYFGRTTIEVKAEGKNFGVGEKFGMPPVTFKKSFE